MDVVLSCVATNPLFSNKQNHFESLDQLQKRSKLKLTLYG